ncbi:hypothetical protein LTSEURB_4787 [Salmonella enterica subsp. enterica serovar Urbana str. R8-2977]|uniref:Uncharacterized protein n=1 Tax=Salmonella enterica subsp. enterica serovar Urbana str. R8-2977 TaxID=913084 RepID=G5S0S7_SALET|nr:hypothetical protein LTSEURB_4787 [Salmonella enterica subsp. enterica serovar Urbana str. R8-2977]
MIPLKYPLALWALPAPDGIKSAILLMLAGASPAISEGHAA